MNKRRVVKAVACINLFIQLGLAAYYFLAPAVILVSDISDSALRNGKIPGVAVRVHKALTPRYEEWARRRIESGVAARLNLYDVPSTEWPIFGSVFYLMATESLQKDWENGHGSSRASPKDYAAGAIEAAKDIITDTNHHWWVREHWGDNYLHEQNVFFRSLLIAGLKSYQALTVNDAYSEMLADQCISLARDLDRSKYGILDDYPGECYPIDVFAAISLIKEASGFLGIDQSEFVSRSKRAFQGPMLDRLGLLPYGIDSLTGLHNEVYPSPFTESGYEGPSRGVGNSYFLIFAPALWPDLAWDWYSKYESNFWQDLWWAEGFREFSRDFPGKEWGFDVDAGPIIAGFSPAANAFGYAAAVANGRYDHAYTLGVQILAASWPLPDGTLLGTKVLSDPVHAPYLGEANLLWLLTRSAAPGVPEIKGGRIPFFVWMMCFVYAGLGTGAVYGSFAKLRKLSLDGYDTRAPLLQFAMWTVLLLAFCVLVVMHRVLPGVLLLLLSQIFPIMKAGQDLERTGREGRS